MTFSAGMAVLCLLEVQQGATFPQAYSRYYDEGAGQVRLQEVGRALFQMREALSLPLLDLLQKCTCLQPQFRPTLAWVRANYPQLEQYEGIELQILETEDKTSSEDSQRKGEAPAQPPTKGYYLKKLI